MNLNLASTFSGHQPSSTASSQPSEQGRSASRVRWFLVLPFLDVCDNVLTVVTRQLTAAGIDLPFPTRPILFHDQTEDSDRGRAGHRKGWLAGRADVPASRKVADAVVQISQSTPGRMDGE